MRISTNWLSDYIDLKGLSTEDLTRALTDIGLEVESSESLTQIPSDVVVGEIISATKHPNADQLQVCQVTLGSETGQSEPLAIVCGAPNARQGLKVAVAQVGCVLPGDFKIKKSKIRGETSMGMLCSEKELGLSELHEGILELPEGAPLGAQVAEVLNLKESILEIKVTPNRSDCLSYLGIARDLGAKLKRPVKEPFVEKDRSELPDMWSRLKTQSSLTLRIEDEAYCGRFVSLVLKDIPSQESPEWLKKRLLASGMRSINRIVDATNYVMLEYGQPSHAYDLRFLKGNELGVYELKEPKSLKTLDGQERQLEKSDLVICDGEGPVGIAGVMGGARAEVREDTRAVVIEVASFARTSVRKTAKRLALPSEASYRFERGTDISALAEAALRIVQVIHSQNRPDGFCSFFDLKNGDLRRLGIESGEDLYPGKGKPRVVAIRLSFARQMLPQTPALQRQDIVEILERLSLKYLDGNEDRLVFEVPSARHDLEREIDLLEEIARIHGYDRILEQLPVMGIRPLLENPLIEFLDQLRMSAASQGMHETVSFPFVSLEEFSVFRLGPQHPLWPKIQLQNPMSEKQSFVPTSLLPLLLKATVQNRFRGDFGGSLFELGRGYFHPSIKSRGSDDKPNRGGPSGEASPAGKSGPPPKGDPWRALGLEPSHLSFKAREEVGRVEERLLVSGVWDQPRALKTWQGDKAPRDFFYGKSKIQAILQSFGLGSSKDLVWTAPLAEDLPFLHPGRSAWIYLGAMALGYLGELHPEVARALKFEGGHGPLMFEINVEVLFRQFKAQASPAKTLKHVISKFPGTSRDLALLCPSELTHGEVSRCLTRFKGRKNLESWELFDFYVGPHVGEGKKSLAYRFYFRSPERTLTDSEIDAELAQLVSWLSSQLGVVQR